MSDLPHVAPPADEHELPARTSNEQLRLLLRLSETLAGTRTVEAVAGSVIEIASRHLGAMFGGVAIVDDDGQAMRFVTLEPLPTKLQSSRAIVPMSSPRPAAVAARERRALFFESLAAVEQGMDDESAEAARPEAGRSPTYRCCLARLRSARSC